MASGQVSARWNPRGFTFIETEDKESVFFHASGIAAGFEQKDFRQGSTVEFEVTVTPRGSQAANVRCTAKASSRYKTLKSDAEGRITSWVADRGFGFAQMDEFPHVFVHATDVLSPEIEVGSDVRGDVVEDSQGRVKLEHAAVTGWSATGDTWHDWAYMPPKWEAQLAGLAEPEPWQYRFTKSSTPYPVLRKYLRGTFLRVLETAKIVEDETPSKKVAAFNTGLVTPLQQEIIAVFEAQKNASRYRLRGFELEGSREVLSLFGDNQPSIARYFDNPADVIFDDSLRFYIAVEHVDERQARAPQELKDNPEGFIAQINAQRDVIKRRVARNYKTAIPQYYRPRGRGQGALQLLVPLCLVKQDRVDLALAVEKINGVYRGNTVLTVDMAYTHARLITRPDTEWLRPDGDNVQPSVAATEEDPD